MYLSQSTPVYGPQPAPTSTMLPIPYRPGYVPPAQSSNNFQAFLNSLPTIIGTLRPQQQNIAPGTMPPTTTPKDNTIWYVLGGAGLLLGAFYLMRKK